MSTVTGRKSKPEVDKLLLEAIASTYPEVRTITIRLSRLGDWESDLFVREYEHGLARRNAGMLLERFTDAFEMASPL
jgi:hypothetical protein